MASKVTIKEQHTSEVKKNQDMWKFPKIPTNQVYKTNIFRISPTYTIKDFQETITITSNHQNVSLKLLSKSFLETFVKEQHNLLHMGLVQIAVKPLLREGLGAPIIVCLRDIRLLNFKESLLALVEPDLSEGPFYFNCFPGYSVYLQDTRCLEAQIMSRGIPLAVSYRLVCKAMVDSNPEALLQKFVLNETVYVQPGIGTSKVTKWDGYELHVREKDHEIQSEENDLDGPIILKKGEPMASKFPKEELNSSQIEPNLETWTYPKIPVDEIFNSTNTLYLKDLFRESSFWSQARKNISKILPTPSIKDFEKTITLPPNKQNVTIKLLKNFAKKQNKYMYLGLVQVEIKPLLRDFSESKPIKVGLRDKRFLDFNNSFSELLETDLSKGPLYFNHFPGHSIHLDEDSILCDVLNLHVMTSGSPLTLRYRVVCKITSSTFIAARDVKCKFGETTYFHPSIGSESITKWEEVQVPEEWKVM